MEANLPAPTPDGVILDRAAPMLKTVRRAHDTYVAAGLAKLVNLMIRGMRKRMRR